MLTLSDGTSITKEMPTHDSRILRECLCYWNKVVKLDSRKSRDLSNTDCYCRGTGWVGRYPGNEVWCGRHFAKIPYELED